MGNRQTTGQIKKRGVDLTFQHNETDSPILPVAHLERLQQFRPDAVDLVLEQTRIEADHRRKQDSRTARRSALMSNGCAMGRHFAR